MFFLTGFCVLFLTGYGQTKWVAEQIVGLARDDFSVPVMIIRAGMIGGHSVTSGCAKDDLLAILLQGMVVSGCKPHGSFQITLSPVDLVSAGTLSVAFRDECYGRAFHMIHSQLISLHDMGDVLEWCGYKLRPVRYSQWVQKLKEDEESTVPWQLVAAINPYLDHWDTYLLREGADAFLTKMEKTMRSAKIMLGGTVNDLVRQGKIPPPDSDKMK